MIVENLFVTHVVERIYFIQLKKKLYIIYTNNKSITACQLARIPSYVVYLKFS